jgi:transcriptional regulator with XRE-family HTH domain
VAVLVRLRKDRGLTQEQLAHAAGLTTRTYNRIESGAAAPGWSTVRRLAEALEVSMADLGRLVEAQQ